MEDLVQEQRLGTEIGFGEVRDTFESIQSICSQLRDTPLDLVPHATVEKLRQMIPQVILQQIRDFKPNPNEPRRRQKLIVEVQEVASEFFQLGSTVVASRATVDLLPELNDKLQALTTEAEKKIETAVKSIENRTADSFSEVQDLLYDAKEALKVAQEAAETAGFTKAAEHFEDTGREHRDAAKNWLWAVAISAIGLLAYASLLLIYTWSHPSSSSSISGADLQLAVAKVLVFSVLLSLLVGTTRIYRAHRHNQVINKHRENALKTFHTFVAGTADEDTKNAVRLQATRTVFSPQVTGYVSGEKEGDGSSTLVEIVRTAGGALKTPKT